MNIAFVTPEYPHSDFSKSGGLGTSIKNLAKGLSSQGVKVTVFVIGQQKNLKITENKIHLVSIAKQKHFAFNWYFERKRYQRIIQKYIDKNDIQLIEAPDWTGVSAFMKFDVPIIIRLHGSDAYFCHLDGRKQKWKHRFLERTALINASALVSVSEFTAKKTKEIFGLNKDSVTIHNGIDCDDFRPLNVNVNNGQLLYFGAIIRKKGVLELAQIFNKVIEVLPSSRLLLIGKEVNDIFEKKSTLTLLNELLTPKAKKNITHFKEVPYQDIHKHIASSHLVVLPSFAEAFPMTWLEALSMEKALISSNIGWANELMVDGVTGYTIDPGNHDVYAEKIIELLNDLPKCTEFGKAGRQHVISNFSIPIIVKQNMAFYNTVING